MGQPDLSTKIDELLQEIRVVLPGTEALLGFQFSVFFSSGYRTLPQVVRNLHLVNMMLITLSSLLLIAPVGFKQIAEKGKDTKRFIGFARKVLLVAMLFLLAGLSGDIYVASRLTLPFDRDGDSPIYIGLACGTFVLGLVLWFVAHFLRHAADKDEASGVN